MSAGYPPHWEADVVLADGGTVHVRPIVPEDGDALVALHGRLSPESRRLRYFAPHPRLSAQEVEHFTTVDYDGRMALVGVLGDEIIAVARYERVPDTDVAEVAFLVDDAQQSRGLGSVLLEHLAAVAAEREIHRFEAEVLADNQRMLRVFREAGYQPTSSYDQEVVHLAFPIEPTAASRAVAQSREHRAESVSIGRLLSPRTVAVVGAGRDPAGVGHVVLANLLRGGFHGAVYPVNATASYVASVRAYPTVDDVPDDIDLAILAVPAATVADVIAQCARKRVRGLVVMSGGYAEGGAEGFAAERAVVAEARANGMRVIGPNCLGIMSTAPQVRLNASLAPALPPRGRAGFFCQSGALGIAILASVAQRGLGLSTFVSAGNRADVSGNDLLQFWEDDPDTDVVLLYLETFGNPRKFARLARRLGRHKPIVAVKSGGSVAARLRDADVTDHAVDALFSQAGVIRVNTLSELFDVAVLLTRQPLPAGQRVAIVGNSSALGRLATDACAGSGSSLSVGTLSDATVESLGTSLGPGVVVTNPLVLPAACDAAVLQKTLQVVLADPRVDAVVTVFVPPSPLPMAEFSRLMSAACAGADKPVVSTFLAFDDPVADGAAYDRRGFDRRAPAHEQATSHQRRIVPTYPSPEEAVGALARAATYAQWRSRPAGTFPVLHDIDNDRARDLAEAALVAAPAGVDLPADEVTALLACYGVTVCPRITVGSVAQALAAGRELGYPVALTASAESRRERPELGAARLDIAAAADLRAAYLAITAHSDGAAQPTVQRMVPRGIATVIRTTEDPSFGALVSFGLGGVATDLLGDRAFRAVPLTDLDATELLRSVRAAPLLLGYRGSRPVDVAALEDLLLRVSRLADELPEVAELECSPVLAAETGISVLNASVRLAVPTARLDGGSRRLHPPE